MAGDSAQPPGPQGNGVAGTAPERIPRRQRHIGRRPGFSQVLVGPHRQPSQPRRAVAGHHRHIGGVPAARDRHVTLAPRVVPRIEGPPPIADVHLNPGVEVHRCRQWRHVQVRQVATDIAGRNVQRPAQRDHQVGEVAAHSVAGLEGVLRRPPRTGAAGAVLQVVPHPVLDAGDQLEAALMVAEPLPRRGAEHVGLAVATRQGERQGRARQLVGWVEHGARIGGVEFVRHLDYRVVRDQRLTGRQHHSSQIVAVQIAELGGRGHRIARPEFADDRSLGRGPDQEARRRGGLRDVVELATDAQGAHNSGLRHFGSLRREGANLSQPAAASHTHPDGVTPNHV